MDTAQWQQGIGVVRGAAADENPRPNEKKPRPEQCVNCPRCNSTNTKFCYYNNYSLSQPRYFCKTCRRYWTEGGTLRNVPVGGGSRRKHRSSSSSSPSIPPKKSAITDLTTPPKLSPDQNPKFSTYNNPNPPIYNGVPFALDSPNPNFSFMDLLKTTANFSSSAGSSTCVIPAGNNSSVFDSNSVFSSGFPVHEIIKPTFNFDQGNGSLQSTVQDHTISSTTGFPFEEPKPVQGLQLDSNGYWNGVLPW